MTYYAGAAAAQPTRVRWSVRAALALGVAASVVANVLGAQLSLVGRAPIGTRRTSASRASAPISDASRHSAGPLSTNAREHGVSIAPAVGGAR